MFTFDKKEQKRENTDYYRRGVDFLNMILNVLQMSNKYSIKVIFTVPDEFFSIMQNFSTDLWCVYILWGNRRLRIHSTCMLVTHDRDEHFGFAC